MYTEKRGTPLRKDVRRYCNLKHLLIDPQGDFVQLNEMDTDAKTVVISDEELGEIKHTQKTRGIQRDPEVAQLEEEEYETDYDDGDDDQEYERRRAAARRKQKSKKRKNQKQGSYHHRSSCRGSGSCRRCSICCKKHRSF